MSQHTEDSAIGLGVSLGKYPPDPTPSAPPPTWWQRWRVLVLVAAAGILVLGILVALATRTDYPQVGSSLQPQTTSDANDPVTLAHRLAAENQPFDALSKENFEVKCMRTAEHRFHCDAFLFSNLVHTGNFVVTDDGTGFTQQTAN